MATLNVTVLTKARLEELLHLPELAQTQVLLLQELRHHVRNPPWVRRVAAAAGWVSTTSDPPPRDRFGRITPGGTAVFWRRGPGRAHPLCRPEWGHRVAGVKFDDVAYVSVYGPAGAADARWLGGILTDLQELGVPVFAGGDYNWRGVYEHELSEGWHLSEMIPTTVLASSPTRCLSWQAPMPVPNLTFPVAGVPHHFLVFYDVGWQVQTRPATRLRRTAEYAWGPFDMEKIVQADHEIMQATNDIAPKLQEGALKERWDRWHLRAETAFEQAVQEKLATLARAGERAKGSAPTTRPLGAGAGHREEEPVKLRRLRRLHRRLAERLRQGDRLDADLAPEVVRGWASATEEGLIPVDDGWPLLGNCLNVLSRAISGMEQQLRYGSILTWRGRFRRWTSDLWGAAGPTVRGPTQVPFFTADDMAADWKAVWAPAGYTDDGYVRNWMTYAAETNFPPTLKETGWMPSRLDFQNALLSVHGSAGFDGWTSGEIRDLARNLPVLADELFDLWTDTTLCADTEDNLIPKELQETLFSWRVAGIPKKVEHESRPIAVGNIITRAWLGACRQGLPAPEERQWAGQPGTSVAHATANWLAAAQGARAGSEQDLTKCYDTTPHGVAAAAMRCAGVSWYIIDLLKLAWTGPRVCHVAGELGDAIWPLRGIPQGDPCGPAALSGALVPWRPSTQTHQWLFLDDRSMVLKESEPDHELDQALENSGRFDAAGGWQEHLGKRQRWSQEAPVRVEHLGLSVDPTAPTEEILPRDGWQPVQAALQRLRTLPGIAEVRERLVAGFIKPKWTWASPLMWPAPATITESVFQTIVKTACRWWCKGRWWAQRVQLHPQHSAAWAALMAIRHPKLEWSAHVDAAIEQHVKILGFKRGRWERDRGVQLLVRHDDDPRVLDATHHLWEEDAELDEEYHADGAYHVFWSGSPEAEHAIRATSRIRCLQMVRHTRHDADGIERVDVEIGSHKYWKKFVNSLDVLSRSLLNVWRSGAVSTQTRRQSAAPCEHCGAAIMASARHLWTECPRFEEERIRLQNKYKLPGVFWASQPRVLSKSGWVTIDAAATLDRRAEMQVAACTLAVYILKKRGDLVPFSAPGLRPGPADQPDQQHRQEDEPG